MQDCRTRHAPPMRSPKARLRVVTNDLQGPAHTSGSEQGAPLCGNRKSSQLGARSPPTTRDTPSPNTSSGGDTSKDTMRRGRHRQLQLKASLVVFHKAFSFIKPGAKKMNVHACRVWLSRENCKQALTEKTSQFCTQTPVLSYSLSRNIYAIILNTRGDTPD